MSVNHLLNYHDAITQVHGTMNDYSCGWLHDLRKERYKNFIARGLPTKKEEAWKYTDINNINTKKFIIDFALQDSLSKSKLRKYQLCDANSHRLVFVNGRYVPELSQLNSLPRGVIFLPMRQALLQQTDLVKNYLNKTASINCHPFDHLNLALMTGGVLAYIPKNTVIDAPLHLLFITQSRDKRPTMSHPRNFIIADNHSQVSVFEQYVSCADFPYFNNVVTKIYANSGAQVNFYKLQNDNHQAFHLGNLEVEQQRDSQVQTFHVTLGGKLAREDLSFRLNGNNASCRLNGLYMPQGKQHMDHHTRIDHYIPNTSSHEIYKGILHDDSTAVFNGKVLVHPGAQQTSAHQSNQNLLLSNTATVNTKPELEIYADDVKCTHGATVGQLDKNALFYLRSRGIDEVTAIKLLNKAFTAEVVDKIERSEIRQAVENLLADKGFCKCKN